MQFLRLLRLAKLTRVLRVQRFLRRWETWLVSSFTIEPLGPSFPLRRFAPYSSAPHRTSQTGTHATLDKPQTSAEIHLSYSQGVCVMLCSR